MTQRTFLLDLRCAAAIDDTAFWQLGGVELHVSSVKDDGTVELFVEGDSAAVDHISHLISSELRCHPPGRNRD